VSERTPKLYVRFLLGMLITFVIPVVLDSLQSGYLLAQTANKKSLRRAPQAFSIGEGGN
jgi:hypothetical protein